MFNFLVQLNISPTANVGVIGIGGLDHLALKFARAWGCRVTAFTINSVTEHFPMSKVNDATEHLRQGKAKYRLVLDNA